MEKSQQECTHNCMTCGAGCSEQGGDGVGKLEKTLNALADIVTEEITCAERLFLKGTGGDCHMPIGAYACKLPDGRIQLLGMVGNADGSSIKKCKVFGETPQEAAQRALRETGCTR